MFDHFLTRCFLKLCKHGYRLRNRFSKHYQNNKSDELLDKDLHYLQFDLKAAEVRAGAIYISILSLIILLIVDIFLFFPVLDVSVVVDGNTYSKFDKNSDGINDFVQDIEPVEDVEYDQFGIEKKRTIIGFYGQTSHFKIILFLVLPTVLSPLIMYNNFLYYPHRSVKRYRIRTLAQAPQAVSYLSMSLRLTPSLEYAVNFASENLEGVIKRGLKKIIWDVCLNTYTTVEEAFIKFSDEWSGFNDSFKHSLYLLRSSLLEKTSDGRRQALDKANSVILTGVKVQAGNYANSLRGPTMIMFSFGILIPIIISTMLPITGIGRDSVLLLAFSLNVLLPLLLLLYARNILLNRPVLNFYSTFNKNHDSKKNGYGLILIIFLSTSIASLPGILVYTGILVSVQPRYGAIIILMAITIVPSILIYNSVRHLQEKRKYLLEMDREFPDALFQLGMRISEGRCLERSLDDTGEMLAGSAVSRLFLEMVNRTKLGQSGIRDMLLNIEHGNLEMTPTVRASLNVAVSAVETNSNDAGEIIIDISNYLRDLRTMDDILKQSMAELLATIKQTGMIFAPLIIGLTTAMYFKLNDNLAAINFSGNLGFGAIGTAEPIAGEAFILIFGIFLILILCIIIYFVSGLSSGGDILLFKIDLCWSATVAILIFSASCIIGFVFFGV